MCHGNTWNPLSGCSSRTDTAAVHWGGCKSGSTLKLYQGRVPALGSRTETGRLHPESICSPFPGSQEPHTKEIECIISCFLKGNCVSQACKTHSTSIIKMHQRKWLTRSSGLAQLQKVIRGLNSSRFLFIGEQKL